MLGPGAAMSARSAMAHMDVGISPVRSADTTTHTASSDRWVQTLSIAVFALTLLYVVFGIPGEDVSVTTETDRVSPLNSWIWLGLFMMAMPVLKQRWREVIALMMGSWLLLLLYLYFALSITWALDPSTSLRRMLFTLLQFTQFSILLTGIRRAPVAHIVIAAVCSAGAFADLLYWIIAPGSAMSDEGLAGLQSQKNETGLLMMYGCLAAVPCAFMMRRWMWKGVYAAAALMMAGLLVATRSSTSQSVVAGAALVMPVVIMVAKLPRSLILAIVATTICAIGAVILGYLAWCGVTGIDPWLPLRGATFTARTGIWTFVIEEIQKRPWFGAGYSSFWAIDPAVQPSLKSDQWFGIYFIINEGHNGYLDQLATGGVVGLAGSLFILFRFIILAGRAMNWTLAAPLAWRADLMTRSTAVFHLSLLLGLILHNFTESNLFANNSVLACAFLICALDLEKWRVTIRASGWQIGPRRRYLRAPTDRMRPLASSRTSEPQRGERSSQAAE